MQDAIDKDTLKLLVQNAPEFSPELVKYLQIAKQNGWDDIVDLIAMKLGFKKEKKRKKRETVTPRKLEAKRVEHTWDMSVDFKKAKEALLSIYKEAYGKNLTEAEVYAAILLIQLTNGMRVKEAVRAFKVFVEGRGKDREFYIQAQKGGNQRYVVIHDDIKFKPSYSFVLTVDDKRLEDRVRKFAAGKLGINTHSLRYAFITHLAKLGYSPSIIAKITGHKRLDRIVQYTESKEAVEILRRLNKG